MKKNAFILLLLVGAMHCIEYTFASQCLSQKLSWCFYKNSAISPEYKLTGENFVLFLGSDTLVDGKMYNNILYKKVVYWNNFDLLPTIFSKTALREDGSKIYHYDYESRTEKLMFDFSLKVGDTIQSYASFVVDEVGDTSFFEKNASKLHYLKMRDLENNRTDFWVEKVGSLSIGVFFDDWWCAAGMIKELICCSENDSLLYQKSDRENCLVEEQEQVSTGTLKLVSDSLSTYHRWFLQTESNQQYALMRNGEYIKNWEIDQGNYLPGDTIMVRGIRSVYYKQDSIYSDIEVVQIKKIETLTIQNYTGTIVSVPYPNTKMLHVPNTVFGLNCNGEQYVLSKNGWFENHLYVDSVCYIEKDSVAVEGLLSTQTDLSGNSYVELEIISIKKILSYTQEEEDYLEEGKLWSRYCKLTAPGEPTRMEYNWFEGADTINGIVWKKQFCAYRSDLQDKRFLGWFCQEGKRIYERRVWASGEELVLMLFDFGAQEGDTVLVHNYEQQVIDRVFDTVFDPSDGKPRRCFQVSTASNRHLKDIWVEGIGSLSLGMTASWISYSGWVSELLCCKKDDDLWYQNALYNTCSIDTEENYLEEGKEWTIQSVGSHGNFWYFTELVSGEVERYGHLWKREFTDGQAFLLYRQEGKKIWACYPYNDGLRDTVPFLMFDFGLEKGDTAHLYVDTVRHMDDAWIVDSVFDSVFEQGQAARRCQSVYLMKNPEMRDVWVEGLGSLANGLVYSPDGFLRAPSLLVCVQRATGDVLYHKYKTCDIPDNLGYDYSVQNWSVLCRDTQNIRHTQWLYFKENGKERWNRAYLSTKEDFSDERPYGWYYQDMLQVYFKEDEDGPAELLYDFGLGKGESVLGWNNVLWTSDTVYRVEINGVERICQQMVSNKGDSDTWIEGLGSLKTGFLPAAFCGNSMELLCVQADVWWHSGYMYHNTQYSSCHIEETDIREVAAHDAVVHYNAQRKELVIGNDFRVDVLEVVDAQGRCVLRVNHPEQSVSVARLPQGLYIYRISVNGIIYSEKFIR